jgi:hypothetical protein
MAPKRWRWAPRPFPALNVQAQQGRPFCGEWIQRNAELTLEIALIYAVGEGQSEVGERVQCTPLPAGKLAWL